MMIYGMSIYNGKAFYFGSYDLQKYENFLSTKTIPVSSGYRLIYSVIVHPFSLF